MPRDHWTGLRNSKEAHHGRRNGDACVGAYADQRGAVRLLVRGAARRHRDHGRNGRRRPEHAQAAQSPGRILANAPDAAAGPDWNADTDFDVRPQDVPLTNRRPDVTVYRAETIDLTPTRPEHVLLVVEVVSPGSETTDRIVKVDQYAKAGLPFCWRVEQAATGVPIVYAYVLDPATKAYRDGEMFTGVIKAAAPFPVSVDLGVICPSSAHAPRAGAA